MKRKTAIRMAMKIADDLRFMNGIIGVPYATFDNYRVKRAWVFGSTAKGNENPNDLDVLIEGFPCGRWQTTGSRCHLRYLPGSGVRGNARLVKWPSGYRHAAYAQTEAFRRLRGNMRMVRFHDYSIDGDLADAKIMIYPRNDLAARQ